MHSCNPPSTKKAAPTTQPAYKPGCSNTTSHLASPNKKPNTCSRCPSTATAPPKHPKPAKQPPNPKPTHSATDNFLVLSRDSNAGHGAFSSLSVYRYAGILTSPAPPAPQASNPPPTIQPTALLPARLVSFFGK